MQQDRTPRGDWSERAHFPVADVRPYTSLRTLLLTAGVLSMSACIATSAPRRGVVYARYAPPPRVHEVVGNSPGTGYVWTPGHHAWRRQDYLWVSGRYAQPARGYRGYEPGRWVHERAGWFWVEGRWR